MSSNKNSRFIVAKERPNHSVLRFSSGTRKNKNGKLSRKKLGWVFVNARPCLNEFIDYAGEEKYLKSLGAEDFKWLSDFIEAYYLRNGEMFEQWKKSNIDLKRAVERDHYNRSRDFYNENFGQKVRPRARITFTDEIDGAA